MQYGNNSYGTVTLGGKLLTIPPILKSVIDTAIFSEVGILEKNYDSVSILAKLQQDDSSLGSEVLTLLATILQSDTGMGTDKILGLFSKIIEDNSTTIEIISIINNLSIEDSGTFIELLLISLCTHKILDTSTGVELLSQLKAILNITDKNQQNITFI